MYLNQNGYRNSVVFTCEYQYGSIAARGEDEGERGRARGAREMRERGTGREEGEEERRGQRGEGAGERGKRG